MEYTLPEGDLLELVVCIKSDKSVLPFLVTRDVALDTIKQYTDMSKGNISYIVFNVANTNSLVILDPYEVLGIRVSSHHEEEVAANDNIKRLH